MLLHALILFVLIWGSLLMLAALIIAAQRWAFLRRGVRVPGVVATLESHRLTKRTTRFVPTVSFTALTGQMMTVRAYGIFPINPSGFHPGQPISIVYDPADPNKATIAPFYSNEWACIILAALGLFLIALSMVITFVFHISWNLYSIL